MSKKIIFNKNAREKIISGINTLADSVKITLGPKGRNVVIWNGNDTIITNDGVTIAKAIELEDEFENIGAQLIKQAAEKTEKNAGDGTTTVTILTQSIIKNGIKWVEESEENNPIFLMRSLQKYASILIDEIKKRSIKIDSIDKISQIATISANNDKQIGKLIGEAYEKIGFDGIINIEESSSYNTFIKKIDGMEIEKSILSPYFITDPNRQVAELENPLILIVDDKIFQLKQILPMLKEASNQGKPIFIIAEDIEGEALSALVVNATNGNLKIAAIKAPGVGKSRRDKLDDIATFTGSKVFSSKYGNSLDNFMPGHFGTAKKIICGETTVVQNDGKNVESINKKIDYLKEQLNNDEISNFEKEIINYRLAKLSISIAVLMVGASTQVEMKERRMRIDDAINSVKSAIDEGFVPGGGIVFLNCINKLKKYKSDNKYDNKAIDILVEALKSPISQIANNSGYNEKSIIKKIEEINGNKDIWDKGYDASNDSYTNLIESGIIDPTKVLINSINNSISISSLVLTTEVVIGSPKKETYY